MSEAALTLPTTGGRNLRRWQKKYAIRVRVTDALIVTGSVMLAQLIRFGGSPSASGYDGAVMTLFSVVFALLWLSSLEIFQTRSTRVIGGGLDEYRRVAHASFQTFGIIAIITLLAKIELARGYLAVALPVGTLGLLVSRNMWRRYVGRKRAQGAYQTRVLAIGDRSGVEHLARELLRNPKDGYAMVGVCIPGYGLPHGETLEVSGQEIPILGDDTHAAAGISACGADTVAVARTEQFGEQRIRELMWQLETMDIDLVVSPGVMDVANARLALRPYAGFPLLHVEKPQYEETNRFQKRAFDFCFALAAIVVTFPVMLVCAVAIRLTSKGPVFYRAERIGLDGKPFTMLKFRTMVDGADQQVEDLLARNDSAGGVLFKMREDPRITRVGKVLRKLSIDELPQFINVLKQDMSVVGPRPPLRREVDTYDVEARRRLLVKPGVTGLWQVSGRSDLSWEDSVRLDLSYVDNWSMAGDLMIVAKTIKVVLVGDGAY
ncbi:UDP-phosphate galactosephosphotransferase [Mycobacterium lentiflavum]|uniref:Sugar transferase n=1 Tax=Mycobacterium lentiflavum TaxID=141349 RepID=A0A0E3WDI5_MYCLN|nr:sugar transferase [Mycobacterium lentiflavum]MEE3065415.1 sugar transferase [Actinomycetota bacterium]ULP41487.1 sugar transferase [Mycobacterium lentiflavum]CQD20069.1 UDP-phosphate galactosephosphotransferase [Mycobacterium lentiflavum]